MTLSKKAFWDLLSTHVPIKGASIRESGRRFSIKKDRDERVAGIRLDVKGKESKAGAKCDGLFILWRAGSESFDLVFVELKGNDVDRAVEQIEQSSMRLCSNLSHRKFKGELGNNAHHAGRALGLIIAGAGASVRHQRKRLALRKRGLVIKIISRKRGAPVVVETKQLRRALRTKSA